MTGCVCARAQVRETSTKAEKEGDSLHCSMRVLDCGLHLKVTLSLIH